MSEGEVERTSFRVIELASEQGVPFPPVLVKLCSRQATGGDDKSHPAPPSSQISNPSSARIVLEYTGARFVNGRQQLVQANLTHEDVMDAVRIGLKSPKMDIPTVIKEIFARFDAGEPSCSADFVHERSELKITFNDIRQLVLHLKFEAAEASRATPAFVLAFEGARALASRLKSAESASARDAQALADKERDLMVSDRKLQNAKQELSDKTVQLNRLLATGGSSLGDVGINNGDGGRRSRSVANDGEGSVLEDSPNKKRKAAPPTLAKAGRTVRERVRTGFVDEDDEDPKEEEEASRRSSGESEASTRSSKHRGATMRSKSARDEKKITTDFVESDGSATDDGD